MYCTHLKHALPCVPGLIPASSLLTSNSSASDDLQGTASDKFGCNYCCAAVRRTWLNEHINIRRVQQTPHQRLCQLHEGAQRMLAVAATGSSAVLGLHCADNSKSDGRGFKTDVFTFQYALGLLLNRTACRLSTCSCTQDCCTGCCRLYCRACRSSPALPLRNINQDVLEVPYRADKTWLKAEIEMVEPRS